MWKTAVAFRNGKIDSHMSVEWPDAMKAESVLTLAQIRKENPAELFEELVGKDVIAFCKAYTAFMIRARYNMLDTYLLNTEEPLTDEFLIAYHKQHKGRE